MCFLCGEFKVVDAYSGLCIGCPLSDKTGICNYCVLDNDGLYERWKRRIDDDERSKLAQQIADCWE